MAQWRSSYHTCIFLMWSCRKLGDSWICNGLGPWSMCPHPQRISAPQRPYLRHDYQGTFFKNWNMSEDLCLYKCMKWRNLCTIVYKVDWSTVYFLKSVFKQIMTHEAGSNKPAVAWKLPGGSATGPARLVQDTPRSRGKARWVLLLPDHPTAKPLLL
jgi:hypothetical protein